MQTTLKKKYDAPKMDVVWVRMEASILQNSGEGSVYGTRQGYDYYSLDEE